MPCLDGDALAPNEVLTLCYKQSKRGRGGGRRGQRGLASSAGRLHCLGMRRDLGSRSCAAGAGQEEAWRLCEVSGLQALRAALGNGVLEEPWALGSLLGFPRVGKLGRQKNAGGGCVCPAPSRSPPAPRPRPARLRPGTAGPGPARRCGAGGGRARAAGKGRGARRQVGAQSSLQDERAPASLLKR